MKRDLKVLLLLRGRVRENLLLLLLLLLLRHPNALDGRLADLRIRQRRRRDGKRKKVPKEKNPFFFLLETDVTEMNWEILALFFLFCIRFWRIFSRLLAEKPKARRSHGGRSSA